MPFAIRDLSVLSYAAGFTHWHYKAGADAAEKIAVPGYMQDASE